MNFRPISMATAFLLICGPAAAQDFGADFKVTGRFEVNIGEDYKTLYTVDDLANDRPGVDRYNIMGKVFFNIAGFPEEGGTLGSQQIEVQIGPDHFPPQNISSITLIMDGAVFVSDDSVGGSADISNVVWGNDGSLSFGFFGLVRAAKYNADGDFVPIDPDLPLLEVEGSYEGMMPLE